MFRAWGKINECYVLCNRHCSGYRKKKATVEVFANNTNLTFLYKIVIDGFSKFSKTIYLPPVGLELTTLTINGLQV